MIGEPMKLEEAEMTYRMPAEDGPHEGTWLVWPHPHTYGAKYQKTVEPIWVQMAEALHTGERVHIVAYSEREQARIGELLLKAGVSMAQVDYLIAESDDVWVRDTGPMFVFDEAGGLAIADFDFDGWGKKAPYAKDNRIPALAGVRKGIPVAAVPGFVLEGGSFELDGSGTLMACRSSVISKNRNPMLGAEQAEAYLARYLGVRNFIWLAGVTGEDITDGHIDGMARFLDDRRILTVSRKDFAALYDSISMEDYDTLRSAKNARGEAYEAVEIPLTRRNAKGLRYKGSYLNYYIGNRVVLAPIYGDDNDKPALQILAGLYPGRKIVPINVNGLFRYGGMLHCVTQQQPVCRHL